MSPPSPPQKPRAAKVQVSRGLLIALAAIALAGVLGVAFLVGRESARGQPATSAQVMASALPSSVAVPPGTTSTPNDEPPTSALPTTEAPPPSSPLAAPREATPPNAAAAPHDKLRDDVASYFREVEAIQSQAKSWSDPEALAQKLMEQAGKGDVSGFDGLAAANLKVRDNLRALPVPEPCREHHRVTLALLDESIAMLDRVKGQISGGDVSSLAAMATAGRDLEQKAKSVDAMAAEIKRHFGL